MNILDFPLEVLSIILNHAIKNTIEEEINLKKFANVRTVCKRFELIIVDICSQWPFFKEPLENREEVIDLLEDLFDAQLRRS